MSEQNSEPIKTIAEWLKRVEELEKLQPLPWPFPDADGPPAEDPQPKESEL